MIIDQTNALALYLRTFPDDTIINKRGIYQWYCPKENKYYYYNPKTKKQGEARGLQSAWNNYVHLMFEEEKCI